MIGTPCAGGQMDTEYSLSILNLFRVVSDMKHEIFVRDNLRMAAKHGQINEIQLKNLEMLEAKQLISFEIGLYTLANESLVSRGRNHISATAIRQGWDKLFFIDADASFSPEQFFSVACSPYDLCAGACPLKVLPITLNYLPFKKDENYYKGSIRSVDSLLKMREGHGSQHVPIAFIGTAFMCISRRLLLKSAEVADEYQYPNTQTGHLHTHWNMFNTAPMGGKYMSEDWWFCHQARELGFDVMLDTHVIIAHVGKMTYRPEMAHITHHTGPNPSEPGRVDGVIDTVEGTK